MPKILAFSLYFLLLPLTIFPFSNGDPNGSIPPQELWCVAKNNVGDGALQTALDWACGVGGADCRPIQERGPCYNPHDILKTASYAFNDYFLRDGLTDGGCYFDNTAAITSLDPSYGNCKFPSSLTVNNRSFTGSTSSLGDGIKGKCNRCSKVVSRWF